MASSTQENTIGEKSPGNGARAPLEETEKALAAIQAHLASLRNVRPTIELCEKKTPRTITTVENILKAAKTIFIRNGHAGLSLRKVADEAGIAVGNLTYHFPTKNALLYAMMRDALADYVEAHLVHFNQPRASPLDILLNVIDFYVRNARDNHQFFYQLWGYAGSSAEAREMVRELYRPVGRFVYYLVRAANPKLTDLEIRKTVLQLFSLEEGYKLLIGMGPDNAPVFQNAEEDIRNLARRIICTH